MTRTAVIAGGSGGIGRSLANHLSAQGYAVSVLSRGKNDGPHTSVVWDGQSYGEWAASLEGADLLVNLCGSPINQAWTPARVSVIRSSRVDPTNLIGHAVSRAADPPRVWLNANATGIYGGVGRAPVSESTRPGTDQLALIANEWSEALWQHRLPATKRIEARFGVVLGPFGALPKLVRLAHAFMGAPAGKGTQHVPWIHIHDLCRLVEFSASTIPQGIVNFVAPEPVTNAGLMHSLADRLGRPRLPAVPAPVFRFVARLTGNQPEIILTGRRVLPVIALANGFQFSFPTLESALNDLVAT